MRDLSELHFNEEPIPFTARIIDRPSPTDLDFREFEAALNLRLPDSYVSLLRFLNGGHPQVGTFTPPGIADSASWMVNVFYYLGDERTWKAYGRPPRSGKK